MKSKLLVVLMATALYCIWTPVQAAPEPASGITGKINKISLETFPAKK
jgi:hypothetical protein